MADENPETALDLSYREMTPGDLPAVLELRVSTRENAVTLTELEQDYGITPRSLAEAMRADVRGWLCEASGGDGSRSVAGFVMGVGSSGEVQVVAVHPDYEGHGIGRALLYRVQGWLFSLGHEEIWLLANPDPDVRAHGFYRKFGWRATGAMKGHDEVMVLLRPAQPTP